MMTELPDFATQIKLMSSNRVENIMDMMKVRMRFNKDFENHAYFFTEPDYESALSKKAAKRLK